MTSLETKAAALMQGETIRMVCPYCKAAHEASLALYRNNDGAFYKCHRASCGARGRILEGGGTPVASGGEKPVKRLSRRFEGIYEDALGNPELEKYDHLLKSYERELIDEEWPVYYTSRCHMPGHPEYVIGPALIWPLSDSWGAQWGWEARPLTKTSPKRVKFTECINYAGHHAGLHYAKPASRSRPIIVEDWWSAEVLGHYGYNAIALLGATLNRQQVQELCRNGYRHCTLWLDSDATAAEARIVRQWDGILEIARPAGRDGLPDPKYLGRADILDVLRGAREDARGVLVGTRETQAQKAG